MDDFKNLLRTIAPTLGTAIAGPLGGVAASFLAGKLGIEEKTIEAVTAAVSEGKISPDQIASIKLAEIEFQKFVKTNQIDLEKVHADDRKDARQMLVATRSNMPAVLTIMLSLGFFSVLGWMLYDPSVKDSPPLMIMLGALGAEFAAACKFWLGTTNNSQEKTNLLANSAPAK